MAPSRRVFLQQASAFTLLGRTGSGAIAQMAMPQKAPMVPRLRAMELAPFVDALPLPERIVAGAKPIRIAMRETMAKLHRDLPATRVWAYSEAGGQVLGLAPLIEARSGKAFEVEWVNELPEKHFLPVDHSLHGCGTDVPEVRAVVHLHGAKAASKDDGYPEDWFVKGQSRRCVYPMEQEAATLWYHDHAMGLNRLNTYAGLFGMAIVRDEAEEALGLPSGAYELPLILTDRLLTTDGQLLYPTSDIKGQVWVPEFAGDALLVNGKVRPYVEVEPRLYRLRVLNAANSRFFPLTMVETPLVQIGSDQGLLAAPVALKMLMLAPAERADLLVDFSKLAGQKVRLRTGSVEMMEFRVGTRAGKAAAIPAKLRAVERMPEAAAVVTRTITLNEFQDELTRPMVMLLNRKHWHEPVTEKPKLGTTEIWEFVNLTDDTHPMHLHLVRFQVLDRRVFDTYAYLMQKELKFVGEKTAPAENELGWKDVVQCPAGMITRIIVRFEGFTGKYLYHCHILEHEANDMMRPFEVV